MPQHWPENMLGQTAYAWCNHCGRQTKHRIDRVAVGAHAGKQGPCLEHHAPLFTKAQHKRNAASIHQHQNPTLFDTKTTGNAT